MKNNQEFQKGYTLVELLAVILIIITVGGIISAIIASSLRGSNRSTNVNEVRQEGNYAITQMSKTIRYAKTFSGVSTDGVNYDLDCTVSPITPTPATVEYKYLKITLFDGSQTIFNCKDASSDNPRTILSNSENLINTSKVTIKADSCNFICIQQNSNLSPTIDINFTLEKKTQSTLFENVVSVPFKTSVIFRNNGE